MIQQNLPSVHDLRPLENGGTIARIGFLYQDHIAVGFLLDMFYDESLVEVWCEADDDVTLLWERSNQQEVEFVQVKNVALNSFWSVAKLCKREKTNENSEGLNSSLIEKSFAHDRCREKCSFRIITSLPVSGPLNVLSLPISSPKRALDGDEISTLVSEIKEKVSDLRSPNNHDVTFWVANSTWQVQSEDNARIKNKSKLMEIIMHKGIHLSGEIIETRIYPQLLSKVQEAACTSWDVNNDAKKIKRKAFLDWLDTILQEAQYPLSSGSGEKLEFKMKKANIGNDYIITAKETRIQFRRERLNPKYLDLSDLDLIEGEVLSELNNLRLRLDLGELPDGIPFLKTCQDKLRDVQGQLNVKNKPPLFYLDGCMYDITDRCAHRYHREAK